MELLDLSAHDREAETRNRALSIDNDGREILIGLDRAESEWLLAMLNQRMEIISDDDRERFLKLYGKHERAKIGLGRPSANDI
jgi:hypothetical protein